MASWRNQRLIMTPERWKNLEALFHGAIALQPEARASFLAAACGGDEQLRREAEKMIAASEGESSLIDAPIFDGDEESRVEDRVGSCIGPYQIISQLGRGGMGEVYLAEDCRLGRKVAIKVLPSDFTKTPDCVRRFELEAKAASALNHPNILTIHEIGRNEGLHFIATEFVEGVTLTQRMAGARMSLAETFSVAVQVASALAAAHANGIVHRDIKPDNVMVRPDGLVKVLDFGLAKLMEQPAAVSESRLFPSMPMAAGTSTEPGLVMGTINYMSPEQARGLSLDHRTDIFSLGVLLYEMIVGHRPFQGETPSDVMAAILHHEPQPISELRRDLPPELEQIVSRILEKEREARYQNVSELRAELQKLERKVETVSASESDAVVTTVDHAEQTKANTPVTITARERRMFLSSTKARWQVAVLSFIAVLLLSSFLYSRFFRKSSVPPPSPQMRSLNIEAHNLYLKGRYQERQFTEESIKTRISYFSKAIEKDPNYALAYSGLADSYIALATYYFVPPKEALVEARHAAERAVQLDEMLAEAHVSLSMVRFCDWDWRGYEKNVRQASDLNPNYAKAYYMQCQYLAAMGRFEEANAVARHAQQFVSPLDISTTAGWIRYFERKYDEAIAQHLKSIEIDRDLFRPHRLLGLAYLQKKQPQQAIAAIQRSVTLSGGSLEEKAYLGHAYAVAG
ncbi:MAG TPA: protein kinase, partial [Pyrinomonadaceae bacterium]|nr:protein kinase [Pyrinomonadaceae bacterium]